MLKKQFIKKRSKIQQMLCNFIFSSFLVVVSVFKANSHEELLNSLVISHPYLIKESKTEAFGFLSIQNTGSEKELLNQNSSSFYFGIQIIETRFRRK